MVWLLAPALYYGQDGKFTVSGTITDCKTKDAIKGITIKLVGSDQSSIETKSDSLGQYSFSNCFKNNTDYVLTAQTDSSIGRGTLAKYGICPDGFYEKAGYLNGNEKYKFFYSDSLTKQEHDFCLIPIIADYYFPSFYFKKNSTEFKIVEWGKDKNADTVIDCFVSFLMAHKTYTLILSGHSSKDENNKKELAEARTKKLFDLFVSKGIDKERLECKSYSDTKPFVFYDEDGRSVVKKSKDIINEKSRRIAISLLRKDYDPKTKKPFVESKDKINKTEDDSEEEH